MTQIRNVQRASSPDWTMVIGIISSCVFETKRKCVRITGISTFHCTPRMKSFVVVLTFIWV